MLVRLNNGMAASVWDFLTCAQMLMHAIAHGGCTDTLIKGSSLLWKLTLEEKSLAAPGTRTRASIAPGFSRSHTPTDFQSDALPTQLC